MLNKVKIIIITVMLLLCGAYLNTYAAEPIILEFEDMAANAVNPPSGYGEITIDGEAPRYLQVTSSYSGYSVEFTFDIEEAARYDMGIWVSGGDAGQNNAIGGFNLDGISINYDRVYDSTNLKPNEWNLINLGQYNITAGTHTLSVKIKGTARVHKFDKLVLEKSNDYSFFSPNEYEKGNFETDDPAAVLKKYTNASYGYVDYAASAAGCSVTLNADIETYGEYDVSVIIKGSDTRGKYQAYVNGKEVGGIISAKGFYDYREIELGRVTVMPGINKVKFTFVEANTGTGIVLSQVNFKAVKDNGAYVSTPVLSGEEGLVKGSVNTVKAYISNYGDDIAPVLLALYYEEIGSAKILRSMELIRPENDTLGDVEAETLSANIDVSANALNPQIEAFVCKFEGGVLLPMQESAKFTEASAE